MLKYIIILNDVNNINMDILEEYNENNISKINMVNDKLMDIDNFDKYLKEVDYQLYII